MKAVLLYDSKFGNTQQITFAMAEAIGKEIGDENVDVCTLMEVNWNALGGVDLLLMGAPTHVANIPKDLRLRLEAMPQDLLVGTKGAAFDTANRTHDRIFLSNFTAGNKLQNYLRKLGVRRIAKPESFWVIGREGPMELGEVDRAAAWALKVLAEAKRLAYKKR